MDRIWMDLRHTLRLIRQRPLFALVASLSIAIGVGATTVIVSVMNAVLFEAPPGIEDPERVVEVGRTSGGRGFDTFSFPELLDMQRSTRTLDAVAGWRFGPLSFSTGAESERIMGLAASAEYFDVFGLKPARGRFYTKRGVIPHHRRTDGGMLGEHAYVCIWTDALERIEVFGESLELPARALQQRLEVHSLHHREVFHHGLAQRRRARRDAEAAVAHDRGGDAERNRRREGRIPGDLRVVVRVHVDDPGHEEQAAAVDCLLRGGLDRSDFGDAALADANVSLKCRLAAAVDD